MLKQSFKTACLSILVLVALFISGSADQGSSISFSERPVFTSHHSPVVSSNTPSSLSNTSIQKVKIKIRYKGSECNYFTTKSRQFSINPEYVEKAVCIKCASLVNSYFYDSYYLRGPPSSFA